MPQFLWPGHNYLGPGNPLENGPTVDKADEIAKRHDYAYHNAQTASDITTADKQAIGEFGLDFIKHPNISSLAGAVGLTTKFGVEKLIGTHLYPNL